MASPRHETAPSYFMPLPEHALRYTELAFYGGLLAINTPELSNIENRIFTLTPALTPTGILRYLESTSPDIDKQTLRAGTDIADVQHGIQLKLGARNAAQAMALAFEKEWMKVEQPIPTNYGLRPLRPRNSMFLKAMSEGLDKDDIARVFGYSPKTVYDKEISIRNRWRVQNISGAIVVDRLLVDIKKIAASDHLPLYDVDVAIRGRT